jgi:hypothetical protein
MRLESYLVAEMLQRLEQQGGALRGHTVEIATALGKDDYPAALASSVELQRVLDKFVSTMEVLQDHIVAHDGMGALGEAFGELTLRARALVLLAQLGLLRDALRSPAAQARARGWFVASCPGIDELTAFVRERLTTIHAIWMPYRGGQPQPRGMSDADRANIYRTVVRVAQRALCELPDEPPLARFLEHGIEAADLPEVQLSCRQIVLVLSLEIDPGPARPFLRKPRRLATVSVAPEEP